MLSVGMKTCLEGIETSSTNLALTTTSSVGMKTCLEGIETLDLGGLYVNAGRRNENLFRGY